MSLSVEYANVRLTQAVMELACGAKPVRERLMDALEHALLARDEGALPATMQQDLDKLRIRASGVAGDYRLTVPRLTNEQVAEVARLILALHWAALRCAWEDRPRRDRW